MKREIEKNLVENMLEFSDSIKLTFLLEFRAFFGHKHNTL